MWTKVTNIEQLESLHEGSMIAIHPLQGHPKDDFDESDMDQVSHRLVAENDKKAKMISTTALQRKEQARTITSGSMGHMILDAGYMSYADMIEQGVWWVQQGY